MRFLRTNKGWLAAAVVGVLLGAAAIGMAQRGPDAGGPIIARNEQTLSTIYRDLAKEVLPSIVSIETRSKGAQTVGAPLDEDDLPFKDFFNDPRLNDPRLRDLFRNRQRGLRDPRAEQPSPMVRGMGSGFIIDAKGLVMTNAHVVRDADEVKVRLQDGREFLATDIKADPRTDVAVIRLPDADNLKALPLGDSEQMEIGDWVLAVGSPFGLDLTVTHGIISAKGRGPGITEREDFLQTDAPINPGNSGGPLVNLRGEAIGINTAISTRSGGSQGVAFTIPINMARWVADQLATHGVVKRAYLGVAMQPVDHTLAKKFGVAPGAGVIVNQIVPGSPAADAKVQSGDVIVELAGKSVKSPHQMQELVEQLAIGKEYPLVVLRDGQRVSLQIEGREMPKNYTRGSFDEPSKDKDDDREARKESPGVEGFGMRVSDLTPEVAKEFGVTEGKGVVVISIAPDSPANIVGVRPGDVILEVNRKKIGSAADFEEAAKAATVKDGVLLLVKSARGTRYLSIQAR